MRRLPKTAVGMVEELPMSAHDFKTLAEALTTLVNGERFPARKRPVRRRKRQDDTGDSGSRP